MKSLIAAVVVSASTLAFGGIKIGTVDMMTLVKKHPSYEVNKALLQTTEQDYRKRTDEMRAEIEKLQAEGQKLAEEYKNPMLAKTAKAKLEEDLTRIQKDFFAKQQELRTVAMENQDKLSELEGRLLKLQAADIKEWISGFAKDNDYDFVFDVAAVPFSTKNADVTDGVVKFMSAHPKAAKSKE